MKAFITIIAFVTISSSSFASCPRETSMINALKAIPQDVENLYSDSGSIINNNGKVVFRMTYDRSGQKFVAIVTATESTCEVESWSGKSVEAISVDQIEF